MRLLGEQRTDGTGPAEIRARARAVLAAREVRATLSRLEEAGSPVRYLTVDVRDGEALASALREVREAWGPVTGIVHGAGVLADKRISDKTDEQFDRVMTTKTDGLRALLAATADDPVETICLFSSVAGVFGNAGQCDYAMANAVLDHVASAERARRPDCRVRSIAWGPWHGGMVTPALAERFHRSGVELIPLERGAAAFTTELDAAARDSRIVVMAGDGEAPSYGAGDPPAAHVRVTSATHPYLADHRVADDPVLPLAVVLDWFTGAAGAWRPTSGVPVLRDVRVLDKVTLPGLENEGHRFTVHGRRRAVGPRRDWRPNCGTRTERRTSTRYWTSGRHPRKRRHGPAPGRGTTRNAPSPTTDGPFSTDHGSRHSAPSAVSAPTGRRRPSWASPGWAGTAPTGRPIRPRWTARCNWPSSGRTTPWGARVCRWPSPSAASTGAAPPRTA